MVEISEITTPPRGYLTRLVQPERKYTPLRFGQKVAEFPGVNSSFANHVSTVCKQHRAAFTEKGTIELSDVLFVEQ